MKLVLSLLILGLFIASCATSAPTPPPETPATVPPSAEPSAMQITSPAFVSGGEIPVRYTCAGEDISPPLQWTGVPEEAQSLVLIMEDPDAPGETFVHWVIYNIPTTATDLAEGVSSASTLQDGSLQGTNEFGTIGYGGPCPPPGPAHRYFFRLFALDTVLDLSPGATKAQLESAMEGHILTQGELISLYARQ